MSGDDTPSRPSNVVRRKFQKPAKVVLIRTDSKTGKIVEKTNKGSVTKIKLSETKAITRKRTSGKTQNKPKK